MAAMRRLSAALAATLALLATLLIPGTAQAATTYYVDAVAGLDSNTGTSTSTAFKSLTKVSALTLVAGDRVLVKRGSTFANQQLLLNESGTASLPIQVDDYGTGSYSTVTGPCVLVTGSNVTVSGLQANQCTFAGYEVRGDNVTLTQVIATGNIAGVLTTSTADDTLVTASTLTNNNRMSVNTPGGSDDSGAFGVALNGTNAEVSYSTISGHDAQSYDFGRDGSAVELYQSSGNFIHHNTMSQNNTAVELGGSSTANNTIGMNLITSTLTAGEGIVVRGAQDQFGPNLGTYVEQNTLYLTGSASKGVICYAGCTSSVMRAVNNVADVAGAALYTDGTGTEQYNVWYRGTVQTPALASTSVVADPQFVTAGSDFHLKSTSPGQNNGYALTSYTTDRAGAAIQSPPDRGAYQS